MYDLIRNRSHSKTGTLVLLTTQDASKYLNVSMSTLTRWITDRDVPAHLVDGCYWINRTELLEWAILNKVEVYPELVDRREAN